MIKNVPEQAQVKKKVFVKIGRPGEFLAQPGKGPGSLYTLSASAFRTGLLPPSGNEEGVRRAVKTSSGDR